MFDGLNIWHYLHSFFVRNRDQRWVRSIAVVAITLGVCFGVEGVWMGFQVGDTVALSTNVQQECLEGVESEEITVDVSGAVVAPGVYVVPSNSRGSDALAAAGGFSAQADLFTVAAEINLAQPLDDGVKVYIPFNKHSDQFGEQRVTGSAKTAVISVNTATAKELETLAGVGEKRAADIVSLRPYHALSELVTKGVLTQNILDANAVLLKL